METDQVKIIKEKDNPACNICLILTIHDNENNNIKTWFFSDRHGCLLKSRIFVLQKTAARNDWAEFCQKPIDQNKAKAD